MDTAPLKSFATWARIALIREVTARVAVVLAPASPERVEQPLAVGALEKAIAAANGGEKGRSAVADRVAYTWFNRIIALRFMDANGYTGIGVVSPQSGVELGQPEILAEAKRANIDPEVVSGKSRAAVTGLLNGTRRSDDPQGEAYALLLAEYCRHWNRSMPFMFERTGDFTELLFPGNLLADDSVLNRAVKVLTESVCQDVEVIGWLYQFYISERKDEVFAGFKKNKKAGADEIPAATQLFTPHWIVRYLVENSLGRLWMLNNPTSRLVDQMEYFIAPIGAGTDFLKVNCPEELTVLDPACGSGHMLSYAFDLLYAIYEEEGYAPSEIPELILAKNLYGIEIDPRAGALAAFALAMKARRRQRTYFNKPLQPGVCVLASVSFGPSELDLLLSPKGDRAQEQDFWNQFSNANTVGSLVQPDIEIVSLLAAHLENEVRDVDDLLSNDVIERALIVVAQATTLTRGYAVVVANPPYMGSKNMGPELSNFARSWYPDSKSDLYSMFIERNLALCLSGGFVGMIAMQSWMFLSTFAPLRGRVLGEFSVASVCHLGSGAFDSIGGEVVSTAAFVICVNRSAAPGVYLALKDFDGEDAQSAAARAISAGELHGYRYEVTSADFRDLPLSSMAYWLSPDERRVYERYPALGRLAETKQGLATGDNNQFLRYWWEVSLSRTCRSAADGSAAVRSLARWFPVQKGGTARRWVGNDEYVVNWSRDGEEIRAFGTEHGGRPKSRAQNTSYYFREGATWSSLSGEFAMRYVPAGFVFETKGSMLFPLDHRDLRWMLGYLNTSIARQLIDSLSPTLDYHEGPVARIPVIHPTDSSYLETRVDRALVAADAIWCRIETSPSFSGPGWMRTREERSVQSALETDRVEQIGLEEEILLIEREIEIHIRESGAIGSDVFPVANQTPTGLVDPRLRDKVGACRTLAEDLISYAVGCMMGRYSIDEPGPILANQGSAMDEYNARVPMPSFPPDTDNVIPIVDGDWFEDDIASRFRQFLRITFGERYFEENLRFVTESLGVKDLRDYFARSFYADHVQRYKKRPIYWLFSSPKGSFNALVSMHRYTPSTVSIVLNEYLRDFKAKLEAALRNQERLAAGGGTPRQQAAAQKEADRIRKVLLELDVYEHEVLYPLASQQVEIDLDDGVRVNYPKFGTALKKIPGLEAN
jgi:hypothetical protein